MRVDFDGRESAPIEKVPLKLILREMVFTSPVPSSVTAGICLTKGRSLQKLDPPRTLSLSLSLSPLTPPPSAPSLALRPEREIHRRFDPPEEFDAAIRMKFPFPRRLRPFFSPPWSTRGKSTLSLETRFRLVSPSTLRETRYRAGSTLVNGD